MPLDRISLSLKGLIHLIMPLAERTETDGMHSSRLQTRTAPSLYVYVHSNCNGKEDRSVMLVDVRVTLVARGQWGQKTAT